MDQLLKVLLVHDKELERRRTTALARGWWHKVIDLEARLDYNHILREEATRIAQEESETRFKNADT